MSNIFKPLKIYIPALAILIVFLSFFYYKIPIQANSPDNPANPAPGTNIRVCVSGGAGNPDLTTPCQPIFRWTTSGNPQTRYWLRVDDSGATFPSPEINTGPINSGNNFFQAVPGQLTPNKTYWWSVAVGDSYDWTGWVGFDSFLFSGCNQSPTAGNLSVDPFPSGTPNFYCELINNLSWSFIDPNSGDSQSAYQVQVDDNSDFSSPAIDTGKLDYPSNFYTLDLTRLSFDATYYWRVRVWDTWGPEVSGWASGPAFTTPKHRGPSVDFETNQGFLIGDSVRISFFDRSTTYGGSIESAWLWTFENGIPPSSTQKDAGSRFDADVNQSNVTLRVTDSDGYYCQTTKSINIVGLRIKLKEVIPR